MSRKILMVGFIVVLVLLIVFLLFSGKKDERTYVTHEILVQQIEELGNLEVVKYTIQDLMEYEKVRRWLPNSKTSLKVTGEVIACVDLTRIGKDDIFTDGDSVSLILPMPEICHHKIDHSKSRVYDQEYGLWQSTELVDEAYYYAEQQLYDYALRMGIAVESRENAIKVLTPILRGLGFTRIHIGFKTAAQSQLEQREGVELKK